MRQLEIILVFIQDHGQLLALHLLLEQDRQEVLTKLHHVLTTVPTTAITEVATIRIRLLRGLTVTKAVAVIRTVRPQEVTQHHHQVEVVAEEVVVELAVHHVAHVSSTSNKIKLKTP